VSVDGIVRILGNRQPMQHGPVHSRVIPAKIDFMRKLKGIGLWVALLLGTACLRGQTTRPTTGAAADLSTPRAALRALNLAMRDGDVETIERVFLVKSPAQARMVDADAQLAAALAELRRAAVKAFGDDGAKTVTGDSGAGAAQSLARIDAAEISISGDTATITYPDEKDAPFILKKVDSEWKVPVSQLSKPLDPAALEQRLEDLAVQRKVVREISAKIRSGAFANAEQAREAWQSKILQAATSQPANPRKPRSD
jgi:hypothetical protein